MTANKSNFTYMKKIGITLAFTLIITTSVAQVGIGTKTPDASAVLEVSAGDATVKKGFLPPRLTDTQRNAITNPVTGLTIYNTTVKCLQFFNGSNWVNACNGIISIPPGPISNCSTPGFIAPFITAAQTEIVDVTIGSQTWMDRNLGATTVARAVNDCYAYGNLYQWGRANEGHEWRGSSTTTTRATTPIPGSGSNTWDGKFFIDNGTNPSDWLQTADNNLWQGVNGQNNPCPSGYRIPTYAELLSLIATFTPNTGINSGFNSPIKFTANGTRSGTNGSFLVVGTEGRYRSSTISSGTFTNQARMNSTSNDGLSVTSHASGVGVRCIKN